MRKPNHKPIRLTLLATAIAALSACGGGGGDGDSAPTPTPEAPPPERTTTPVTIAVMDGVLQNATVCLDADDNGSCDAGEVQGRTDASGKVTLQVPDADVGKHPVLALVGTDAVDADSGPVTQAYTLLAPPDATAVVSPWTSLVQTVRRSMAVTTAQAEAVVRSRASLPMSALGDDGADRSGNPDAATSSRAARLLAALQQAQLAAVAGQAGQNDAGGTPMTAAAIGRTVHSLMAMSVAPGWAVATAASSAVADACGDPTSAGCHSAIGSAAAAQRDGNSTLVAENLPAQVMLRRLQDVSLAATGPGETAMRGFSIDWLNFSDANNWYYRALTTSTAGAVPDAQGRTRYTDVRMANTNGVLSSYSWVGSAARQGDTHWNGSDWVSCADGEEAGSSSVRDARGIADSDYCKGRNVNRLQRTSEDVSGKPMADVVARIRATRLGAQQWGPDPATLGSAVMPVGSALIHQLGMDYSQAISYDARPGTEVAVFSPEVAAGGDQLVDGSGACFSAANRVSTPADTLETMVARMRGTPCQFSGTGTITVEGQQLTSPARVVWSSQSNLAVGIVNGPAGAPAYWTSNRLLRLAFTGEGEVTYYSCLQRWSDGMAGDCTTLGTGTYSIAPLGDARIMTFTTAPAQSADLGYERVFVERGGKVYYGWQNKLGYGLSMRLNDVAGTALMTQLGMPTVQLP